MQMDILSLHLGSTIHDVQWRELDQLCGGGLQDQSTGWHWLHDVVKGSSSLQDLSSLHQQTTKT